MRFFIIFLTLLALSGCAGQNGFTGFKVVAPEVSLSNFKMVEMGLQKQTYRIKLLIKNSNSFALPIQSLNYKLFINKQSFATGKSNKAVTIPALGEGYLETDVSSNLADVIEGWQQWFSLAKRSLDYKITGDVGVSSYAFAIPFQHSDTVDLQLK